MTLDELAAALGEPPVPDGTWEREFGYVSAAALRRRMPPEDLAGRVRGIDGVVSVEVRRNGFLRIVVDDPFELVEAAPVPYEPSWPDFPRTWDNPGFVVRYARARACAVLRWAADLGVPRSQAGVPGDPAHRQVLRVLAELPGRRGSRDPGWEAYLPRLALAYHDAHERAPAVPVGDEAPGPEHAARVRVADVVRIVLPGPDRL
ncbi:anticodon-binding protein [Nonomuraea fastidiosa]|jgi:arginyl-tRNA synthetase|uniref:anticodon-binding protein n=1 Tax=Nonomuraea TaxID=83681 RepID=UPI003243324A